MEECLSGSGSICAGALLLNLVVYWCAIYGYTFEIIILGCVHYGIVVRALVRNRRSAVRVPIMEDFYLWFLRSVCAHLVGGSVEYEALYLVIRD